MTELEIATLALEMIAHPNLEGASRLQARDPQYLKRIAEVALLRMIDRRFARKGDPLLSEIML